MDGALVFAVISLLLSIGMAALMAIYPGLRLLWWSVIAFCVAGVFLFTTLYLFHRLQAYMDADRLKIIAAAMSAAIGFLVVAAAMFLFDSDAFRSPAEMLALPIKSGIRLQFFGDRRIPIEISSDNIASWFAYFSASIMLTPFDADKKPIGADLRCPRIGAFTSRLIAR